MLIGEKVAQAKALLKEFNIDCWITFVRESQINGDPTLAFLVNADLTWHSLFVFAGTGEAHVILGEYDKKAVEDLGVYDSVTGFVEGYKQPFLALMKRINPRTIAVNYSVGSEICDGLTHGMYLTLHKTLSEIEFEDRLISAEPIVSALRERKSDTEIEDMKSAIANTERIFGKVHSFIKVGKTEKEIADFMKAEVKSSGLELAWEESVCPAVFTGPETAGAHYNPTGRVVKPGHILNMDFGVKVNGYCSDMQRTFYIAGQGESATPPDVQRGFDTIVRAIESAKMAVRPGIKGVEIDKISRDIIVANGYEEFPHALGHQVGRFSHDGTALLGPAWEKYGDRPFRPLTEGMVFTLEPRLTVPGRGVVTMEEMIVITANGAEYLSKPQKELLLIQG